MQADPALLFHMGRDTGEKFALPSSSPEYVSAMASVNAAVARHQASMRDDTAAPQLDLPDDPASVLCCGSATPSPPYDMCKCD